MPVRGGSSAFSLRKAGRASIGASVCIQGLVSLLLVGPHRSRVGLVIRYEGRAGLSERGSGRGHPAIQIFSTGLGQGFSEPPCHSVAQ